MYYPIQLPYIMDPVLSRHMHYTEQKAPECGGFVVCFWQMRPVSSRKLSADCVIAADGCVDIVAGLEEKIIGFAGMSKTNFHHRMELPCHFIGVRMMPGAFYQLTGLPASKAMDHFLPLASVFSDFDCAQFFSLPFERAVDYFRSYLTGKTQALAPDRFTALFDKLSENAPATAAELYELLRLSPRSCQRLFLKHFGITPKMALSIVRFQACLRLLTAAELSPDEVLQITRYYDQPHFINDFRRNMGITPQELLRLYRT